MDSGVVKEELDEDLTDDTFLHAEGDVFTLTRPQRQYTPSLASRQTHNEKERQRRSRMKYSCDALRTLVPGLDDKTDKATVLEYTVQYIQHLQHCLGEYAVEGAVEDGNKENNLNQCNAAFTESMQMDGQLQDASFYECQSTFDGQDAYECQQTYDNAASYEVHVNRQLEGLDEAVCEEMQLMEVPQTQLVTTEDGNQYLIIETQH